MKNSRGVHARWAELIGVILIHDHTRKSRRGRLCISMSKPPAEPTQEELDMEKDWEPDPPPHLDLEKLAAQSAKLQVRPERICHLEEEQICMNIVFGTNEVQVGWERAEVPETETSDWEDKLNATISELHRNPEGLPVEWENSWDWAQSGGDYPYPCHEQDDKIYYSDREDMLGAAGEDDSDDESDNPAPTVRRSGRTWAPTRQTLESQEQRWEPHGVQVDHTPEPPPPERQPVDAEHKVEEPVPAEEEGLKVQAPPLELRPVDLVLAPVPDHQDVRMDTEGEGLGEPDPLVLARSPEDMSPAIRQHIPGPSRTSSGPRSRPSAGKSQRLDTTRHRPRKVGVGLRRAQPQSLRQDHASPQTEPGPPRARRGRPQPRHIGKNRYTRDRPVRTILPP